MRLVRAIVLIASAAALVACIKINPSDGSASDDGEPDPPDVEGDLGAFDVAATLSGTSCGVGALGMANEWGFVVGLGVDGADATWDVGNGPISGLASGADLTFGASFVMDMRKGGDGSMPACSIERQDLASATLDDVDAPTGFSGTLTYTFTPVAGSNCADLIFGNTAQFATLPCAVQYGVKAKKRTD